MAYNFIPKSVNEIKIELKDNIYLNEIIELYKICFFYSRINDPIAIDLKNIKSIKIIRLLTDKFSIIKKEMGLTSLIIKLGDGSRGNKGENNLGLKFEKDLYNSFNDFNNGKIENLKYKDFISLFYYKNKLYNFNNIEIKYEGIKNNNRPLNFNDKNIYIGNEKDLKDIGKTLSDIIIISGTCYYNLSLKYGNQVTFFNVGCKKIFLEKEIIEQNIKNKNGKMFLNIFEINEQLFCNQFNNFSGPGETKVNLNNNNIIENFLKTGIGYDYYLIHNKNNFLTSHYISENIMNNLSKIEDYKIIYPINGKRINILINNKYLKTNINIRSKNGGIYPTHIMADYKMDYNNVQELI